EARLVDQAEIIPSRVTAELKARVRRYRLQKIDRASTRRRQAIPEAVVAAGPDKPGVAALDFCQRQRNSTVHVVEIVHVGGGKGWRGSSGAPRLVEHLSRLD